mmetsp:Transcript_104844/g.266262  ORF Transcript_104844/g.266262 Transcript_104844/m.266262 type:complete len:274 (+) Transcript_104844:1214-2035(+)
MSGRMRPSAYFSACIVRYFLLAPEPCPMRSKMTSTTRTTFLCLLASSMSRAWPCMISETNSSKVLAWPLPKFSVTMLWLVSICLMFSGLSSTIALNSSAFKFLTFESSMNFASVHLAWLHHSKLLVFSACLSYTWKPAATSLWVTRKFPCGLVSFLACAFSRRSTSSRRRSRMPAWAPASFTSGMKSLSKGSNVSAEDLMAARKGWSMASRPERRFSSFLSRVPFKKLSPSLPHLLGIFTCLTLTSSSPLNGKRPVTMPKMTTPRPQMSTFRP